MSPAKIVRIVNLVAIVAVALIPNVPFGALILAVAGLVLGYFVATENRISLVLFAVFLAHGATALDSIPVIGQYLTALLESTGMVFAAATVTVIVTVVYERLTESDG